MSKKSKSMRNRPRATASRLTEHQLPDEASHPTEAYFRALIENASDAIAVVNADGILTYQSPSFEQVLGYRLEEQTGTSGFEFVHPEDMPRTAELFAQLVENPGGVVHHELRAWHKDGSWRDLEVVGQNRLDDPVVTGLVVSFRDITERKQAEEATRLAYLELHQILNSAPGGMRVIDQAFNVLRINETFSTMFNISKDEALGKKCYKVLPGASCHTSNCPLTRIIGGEERVEYYVEKERSDGVKIPCFAVVASFRGPDGELVGIVQSFVDITERKLAEEALRESEEHLRLLTENVTDVIVSLDLNLKPTYMSPSVTRLLGFSVEEAMARTLEEGLTPASREAAKKDMSRAIAVDQKGPSDRSRAGMQEFEFYRKDGSTVWVEVSVSFLHNAEGHPVGLVTILRDISERKRAEEQNKRMEQQLQLSGRLAAVGELAAGVAHELNNPLAAVQAYAQFLADRKDLDETIKSDVETIYKEAQRASRITSNLLSFARRHEPKKNLISVNQVIEKSMELHAYRMRVNNIEVLTELDTDLPVTMADFYQIQQLFVNLITNAEQAMTEAHGEGKLVVTTQRVGEMIKATFTDDGPGIPEDDLNRIFDPFFTTKDVGEGTGLGLSICYGIVQEHGGRLYATSKTGEGTTFVVEIPIVSEVQPTAEQDSSIQVQGNAK